MRYHLVVIRNFFPPGIAALVVCLGAALAQAPLEPVQHVYPDSTLQEIQQAIDNGGTVYFERLTKATNQYAEYNQIASSTPDLPFTADNPPKGFNIGKNGKDVDIIGVLGPNEERPRINGGTVPFRAGNFPSMGAVGLPVNFRIENLELYHPDLGNATQLYSRIGIWINVIGAQSTINNCKITVTGRETDPGASYHSVGIWFYLVATQPQAPPSGARIDVTNNTVIGTRIHEGIHVDSFWPATSGFLAPRAFVNNNAINVARLGGYPNQQGTNGATVASAIVLAGNVSNSIVTNNVITGDGRSPNATPAVESIGVFLGPANTSGDILTNVTVVGNDLSSFRGDFQLRTDAVVSGSTVARNFFGPSEVEGVMCSGHDNWFDQNHFYGDYPGWGSSGSGTGPGLVGFTKTSSRNRLTRTRLNHSNGICGQVDDETGGANMIPGYDKCLN